MAPLAIFLTAMVYSLTIICVLASDSESSSTSDSQSGSEVSDEVNRAIRAELNGADRSSSTDGSGDQPIATGIKSGNGKDAGFGGDFKGHEMQKEFTERMAAFENQMHLLRQQLARTPHPAHLRGLADYERRERGYYSQYEKPSEEEGSKVEASPKKDSGDQLEDLARAHVGGETASLDLVTSWIQKASRNALPRALEDFQAQSLAKSLKDIDPPVEEKKEDTKSRKGEYTVEEERGDDSTEKDDTTAALCAVDAKRYCKSANPFSTLSCLSTATGVSPACKQRMREVVFCISYANPSVVCPTEYEMNSQRTKADSKSRNTAPLSSVNCIKEETRSLTLKDRNKVKDGEYEGKGDGTPYDKYCRVSKYYAFIVGAGRDEITSEIRMELAAHTTIDDDS